MAITYAEMRKRQWNYVDVMEQDGLFHYGSVVDCAPGGLLIDFGCGDGSKFAPFGSIYHCRWPSGFSIEEGMAPDEPLQVLWRSNYHEPMKWYRGTVLGRHGERSWYPYGFVRIELPNGSIAVILPSRRIRPTPSEASLHTLRLEEGHFSKETFKFVQRCSDVLDKQVIDRFNGHYLEFGMIATKVCDNTLCVLKTTDKFRRQYDRQVRITSPIMNENTISRSLQILISEQSLGQSFGQKTAGQSSGHGCMRKYSEVDKTSSSRDNINTETHSGAHVVISALPQPLLVEIFRCLNVRQQAIFRLVRKNWNSLLTLPSFARVLCLPRALSGCEVILLVCLLRCWTARTRIVVYRNVAKWDVLTPKTATHLSSEAILLNSRVLDEIQREHGHARLDTIVLHNVSWAYRMWISPHPRTFAHFVSWLHAELVSLATVCHNLVLKEVSVTPNAFSCFSVSPVFVQVNSGRVTAGHCITVENLWQIMDDSLRCLDESDFVRLADWITDNSDPHMPNKLLNILYERQSADPRDGVNFRGANWEENDFATLDLRRLTNLTLHSLLRACCYDVLHIAISW